MPAPLPHPLQPADIRLLTELGFVATSAGLHAQARTVFDALVHLRPERAFGYIGMATTHFNQNQPDAAEAILRRGRSVLSAHRPAADDAQDALLLTEDRALLAAFHGLALQMAARTAESRQALNDALALQPEGSAARMACAMLGLPIPPATVSPRDQEIPA